MKLLYEYAPGLILTSFIAMIALWLGNLFPIIGGPVIGILLGILLNNTVGKPSITQKGIVFTSKKILQWAIIVLGSGLSITQVWKTGIDSFSIMFFTLTAAFLAAYSFGNILGIPLKLTTLIGVGTAICGGSAIAAISPVIEAEESEVAYAISTIFLYNVLAVLIFPPIGHLLNFTDQAFGLWAGTAINDTSSVVAAGYVFSNEAGAYATIVKLTRTTMIIPITIIYSMIEVLKRKKEAAASIQSDLKRIFPWFILWFIAASLLNTVGVFEDGTILLLKHLAKFMIVMALTAIGLNADFKKMLKTGTRPIFLGLIVWFTVSITSIIIQFLTHQI